VLLKTLRNELPELLEISLIVIPKIKALDPLSFVLEHVIEMLPTSFGSTSIDTLIPLLVHIDRLRRLAVIFNLFVKVSHEQMRIDLLQVNFEQGLIVKSPVDLLILRLVYHREINSGVGDLTARMTMTMTIN
jgi:hypothetical protein